MAIREYLIIAVSLGVLGAPAVAQNQEPLDCSIPANQTRDDCFCQDPDNAETEICIAWLENGGVVAGVGTASTAGAGAVTGFAPLIAPVAGVLGLGIAAGSGGSSTGTTSTTGTTGTN